MKYLVIIGYFIFSSLIAFGCDCDEPRPSIDILLKTSHNVFIGKFISARIVEYKVQDKIYNYSESEFEVIEIFKGDTTKTIKLLNDLTGCGQIYEKGIEYLLFSVVFKSTQSPHLHRCHSYCPETTEEEAKIDLIDINKILSRQK